MTELVVNGKNLQTVKEIHQFFKTGLSFPDFYGENLDALYDCLLDYAMPPMVIKWVHFDESLKNLGDQANKLADVLMEASEEVSGLKVIIEK
ncbi:barstar family protein [Bacillus sp. FJAT-42376]|uniref:barstar family protein n=1 Tax=Bacillus sp. FJAT-42376 TaxID=2014076 RepID=UPI0013DE5A7E|nr:barstar family protein [Bacillus sp. FJAT-42376]